MNFNKEFLTNLRYRVCIMAVALSAFLYACDSGGSSSANSSQTDQNDESGMNSDDPADTLTVGGSSDGQPTGAAPIEDSVATPGVRMDSLQNSRTENTSTTYGDNANTGDNTSNDGNSNSNSNQTDGKQGNQKSNSGQSSSNVETSSEKKSNIQ